MPRIRSLKPEFFGSPSTADCPNPWARLLFMAMWCWADDWGVGEAELVPLAAFAFPNEVDTEARGEVPRYCREVAASYSVVFYTHRRRRYYQILSWNDHNVSGRRGNRRYPAHDDPESVLDQGFHPTRGEVPRNDREVPLNSGEVVANFGPGTGEQGNRGTGDTPTARDAGKLPANADEVSFLGTQQIVKVWIDEQSRRPPSAVIGQISKLVKQLLEDDHYTPTEVLAGIRAWQSKGLHPSTLPSVVHETTSPSPKINAKKPDRFAAAEARAAERDRQAAERNT